MENLKPKPSFWNQKEKNLGTVIAGTKYEVNFVYSGEKTIQRIVTQCSCTVAGWKDNVVEIQFIPKPKPAHLKEQEITKRVSITFSDSTQDFLYIKGLVI